MGPVIAILSHEDHHDEHLRRAGGRTAPHVEIKVVNEEDRELPRGSVGRVPFSAYRTRPGGNECMQ
ncbi:hypothetical protein [Pseudonocardia sp.]|uniref:hypothetical protein n=1 Tax=Pseudonocardia sp. TaxID=60912 RepID=UPI0039C96D4D